MWNSLPDEVITASTVIAFQDRLDKFSVEQDIKFKWDNKLTSIGSISINICDDDT